LPIETPTKVATVSHFFFDRIKLKLLQTPQGGSKKSSKAVQQAHGFSEAAAASRVGKKGYKHIS